MADESLPNIDNHDIMQMTTEIVASFLSHNSVPAENVPDMIKAVHATMKEISGEVPKPEPKAKPAVPISKSIGDDYIVCLEDGKRLKMLKRYLRSQYDMSPDDYRRKWGLPSDYPMTAPNYSKRRSEFAKEIGLGRGGRGGKK